ncbi:MAG: hypothetical protein ACRD2G_18255, partial [Terriglobia bacterium]
MTKELLVSSSPHETKVAVLEDDQLVEVYFQRDLDSGLVGGIYKGRVSRVLPGMQSAFVDIGLERDAFLYVSDFFEDSEEYDRVFTDAENRVAKATGDALTGVAPAADEPPRAEPVAGIAPAAAISTQAISEAGGASPSLDSQREQAPASAAPANADSQAAGPSTLATPAEAKDEQRETHPREFPKHDSPGRRHRRRGRSFRENRFSFRRDGEKEKPQDAQGDWGSKRLEPLPGESLAKYSQAASKNRAEAPESVGSPESHDASRLSGNPDGDQGNERAALQAATRTYDFDHPVSEAHEETEIKTSGEPATPLSANAAVYDRALEGDGGEPDFESQPAGMNSDLTLAMAEEKRIEQFGVASGELPEEPEAAISQAQDEAFDKENESASSAPEDESTFSSSPFSNGQEVANTGITAPEGETAETASAQTYTLRDSHSHARVAPRRGRKGGRGHFRGQHGRKTEAGGAERPRAGNHQPLPINELLKEGQEILVQIAKEPLGTKGARITSHIALPGRYLVYMPTITHI